MLSAQFTEIIAIARADTQSPREYVDQIIAASPKWQFRDVRYGPGHGGYGCKLYAGSEVVDVTAASLEMAAVECVDRMLERHGVPR